MNSEDAKETQRMKKHEWMMSITGTLLAATLLLQTWTRIRNERRLERQCELNTGFTVIHWNLSHHRDLTNSQIAYVQNSLRHQISDQLERLTQRHGVAVVSNYLGDAFLPAKAVADQVNAQQAPVGQVGKLTGGSGNSVSPSATPKH
jgi:hypothetical protein